MSLTLSNAYYFKKASKLQALSVKRRFSLSLILRDKKIMGIIIKIIAIVQVAI